MSSARASQGDTLLRVVVATLCAVIIGLIFFQLRVVDAHSTYFRLTTFAFIGSVTFFTLRSQWVNYTAGVIFLLFFIQVMFLSKSLGTPRLITDGYIFFVPVASTMIFIKYIYRSEGRRQKWNPVLLGVLTAVVEFVTIYALAALRRRLPEFAIRDYFLDAFFWLGFGFVMGFALGVGIFLAEMTSVEGLRARFTGGKGGST